MHTSSPRGVGTVTRPTIPSSHVFSWRRSGVGGHRGHRVKASRVKGKVKVKVSRTKADMSSSGFEGVAPASVDLSEEHSGPPGMIQTPVCGVIPGVALPESQTDAAAPSLLAPAMLVRLYRVFVVVLPAPPENVNTAERLEQFIAMRSDLATRWAREQLQAILTLLDTAVLLSAGLGARERHALYPWVEPWGRSGALFSG